MPSGSVAAAGHRDKVQTLICLQRIPLRPLKQVVEGGLVAFLLKGSVKTAQKPGSRSQLSIHVFKQQVVGKKNTWAKKRKELHF